MSKSLLIDHEWCSGCLACVVACQMEHELPPGRSGIVINTVGPWEISEDTWQYTYMPTVTDECDLCSQRVSEGKLPTCVHHCQARVIKYGEPSDLIEEFSSKSKQVMYSL